MQSAKEKASFTEQYFDYSGGRENAPTMTVMVGPAGSGKSTIAKSVVNWAAGKTVRVNRDTIRAMMYCDLPWTSAKEDAVRKLEEEAIRMFLVWASTLSWTTPIAWPAPARSWKRLPVAHG